ncbi:hypothetical protein E9232_004889 [Inquilinus ginsengisoli]|uniref:Head protein n=1 Tax=Inquilinus ginsengisoli TaxID=363840 RepID=A0ABU1JWG1_9PROT|nr:DUF5309 domain-containing protein [Inquilinus ginsengisoli]MDR6292349.1 hypothetical protein [Inquilinus ginsengisoli]
MAIVANTFTTFSAIGNREDLADVIYNISPTDTPFMATIGKTKSSAVLHEWQTDALAAPGTNAQLEGDEVAFAAATPTVRIGNRCQISRKEAIVSGTQDSAVDKAGRQREMTYQLMKRSKELRRDMETTLTGNQAPVVGNTTTARQLRPLCSWYATNDSRGAGGADGTATTAATDGTQRALTETLLKGVLQSCWTAGGDPGLVMVGPFNKTVISTFTGNVTKYQDTSNQKLSANIDVYRSDFGTHKIVANRFSRDRDAHVLDTSMWALATLRAPKTVDLAKTGDAEKAMIITEYTLESRNEAASGIVADLLTS